MSNGNKNGNNQRGNGGGLATVDTALLQAELVQRSTSDRYRSLKSDLESRVAAVAASLPPFMVKDKDPMREAMRLISRALMTFLRKEDDYSEIPVADFIRCVVEAAEYGLAIDGKLCYVIRYNGKSAKYCLQFDYKALISIARHCGTVTDVQSDVICKGDKFVYYRVGAKTIFKHARPAPDVDRGEVIGAYAIFFLPNGGHKIEVLDAEDLRLFKAAAPSKNGPWGGVWSTEMQKKCAIKRGMKLYADDPTFVRAMAADDEAWEGEREEAAASVPTFDNLDDRITRPALPPPAPQTKFETRQQREPETVEHQREQERQEQRQEDRQDDRQQEQEEPRKEQHAPLPNILDKLRAATSVKDVNIIEREHGKLLDSLGYDAIAKERLDLRFECDQRRADFKPQS